MGVVMISSLRNLCVCPRSTHTHTRSLSDTVAPHPVYHWSAGTSRPLLLKSFSTKRLNSSARLGHCVGGFRVSLGFLRRRLQPSHTRGSHLRNGRNAINICHVFGSPHVNLVLTRLCCYTRLLAIFFFISKSWPSVLDLPVVV